MYMAYDHSSPGTEKVKVTVEHGVSKDGNAVGLTSILGRGQFVF